MQPSSQVRDTKTAALKKDTYFWNEEAKASQTKYDSIKSSYERDVICGLPFTLCANQKSFLTAESRRVFEERLRINLRKCSEITKSNYPYTSLERIWIFHYFNTVQLQFSVLVSLKKIITDGLKKNSVNVFIIK